MRMSQKLFNAITWIAYEDEPNELDVDVIASMMTVALVADLFKVSRLDVARKVVEYRTTGV